MEVSMKNTKSVLVTDSMSADSMGSGGLAVFATPAMVAGMENVAFELCEQHMAEGETTVGTMLNLVHSRATKIGACVSFSCRVTAVEGRKISFFVEASDEKGIIGEGTHERFVVNVEKFMSRI